MNTTHPTYDLPGASDYADDAALVAYLARLEADERVREFSEEY
jgi:hypothetical protein